MVDVEAVLGVLQQSLEGWEALETDLLEAANLQPQAAALSERVRSATQVVVDAVLHLLDADAFRCDHPRQAMMLSQANARMAE